MTRKDSTVTVRLTKENSDKFKTYAQNNNISQSDFLVELLNSYESREFKTENLLLETSKEISVFLSYENYFLKERNEQTRESKKYTFNGNYIYWPTYRKTPLLAKKYEEKLKEEFGIEQDLEGYKFQYWFGVAKDCEKDRFVVVETFSLGKDESSKEMLNVNRCKFAHKLSNITQHIRRYALAQEVRNIEMILAENITKDEEVESFLK